MLSQSVSPGLENVIHNLTEDTIYSFRVLISNSVGVVPTNRRQICKLLRLFFCIIIYSHLLCNYMYIVTTDVQNVTATPVESMDAFVVQCDFITGSNAKGCMFVLEGEFENITANLEQNDSEIVNVSHPLSCYCEIFAFDIESDGSVGTLAVPGILLTGSITNDIISRLYYPIYTIFASIWRNGDFFFVFHAISHFYWPKSVLFT